MDRKSIGKGITTMILAFIAGGVLAWFFAYGLGLCHFTVLPVEVMESLFGI
jgi:hypothetical protein